MISINCDIGERGAEHPIDRELMQYIDIANLACGGHAGDAESIRKFRKLAEELEVQVSAHLSYPDLANFGRLSMKISDKELLKALDQQYSLIADIKMVKFHGALYNDSSAQPRLALLLSTWLEKNKITEIICPAESELAQTCTAVGIEVLSEAFAERNYLYDIQSKQLSLVPRSQAHACIEDCEEAFHHYLHLKQNCVNAFTPQNLRINIPIKVQSICIHSDSEIALPLARRIKGV